MAFTITQTAKNLKNQINKTPQIVLLIDGIEEKFSTADVLRLPTFDEDPTLFFDDGLFFDTPIKDPKSKAYISLESGTTSNIQNQLIPEKGGAGSIQSFRVALLNKNRELTSLFSSGNTITDLCGRDARVFLGLAGSEFPKDFITIFDGFIDEFDVSHNLITLSIAIPTQKARQNLFNIVNTKLSAPVSTLDTSIPVDSTSSFIIPTLEQEENIKSYLRINDELIKISQTNTATSFDNVLRNQLRTQVSSHDTDDEVTSYIRLQGRPIDLALKLMLSNPPALEEYYINGEDVDRFVQLDDSNTIRNAIFFNFDIKREFNVIEGDLVTIAGATNAANNVTNRLVEEIVELDTGSYIIVTGDLLEVETTTSATIQVKSKYNTLPTGAGLGMKPKYVDLDGILDLDTLLGGSLPDIDIYVKDSIEAKSWLEAQIFKPCGLFALNRKGRYSIYAALPPLNTGATVILDETNITNLPKVKVKRSTTKNHYNSVVYKFEEKSIDDEFRSGVIIVSQDSINRIPVGNKQLTIEAKALRDDTDTRTAIDRQAQRIIDKYKFAPQTLDKVQVNFKTGYTIEVGDAVIFGGDNVLLPDTESGTNNFPVRIMEVQNKSIDTKRATVTLSLLDSAFGLDGRFSVVSPSSYIAGSGGNYIDIKQSFATSDLDIETEKWEEFVGRKVRIRDVGFTKEQILTINRIDTAIENRIYFDEAILIIVDEDDIFDLPDYDDAEDYHKVAYCYINPQVEITSVTDAQNVDVDLPSRVFIGSVVRVNNADYTNHSQEVTVDNIVGSTITFNEPLNYTPGIGDKLELIGFVSDEGLPYRYI